MLPMITQPAMAPACYVPKEKDGASALFDGTDNALSRLASLGNRRKFTVAGCIMRGKLGAYQAVFGTQTDNNNNVFIRFQDTDELQFALTQASAQVGYRVTTAKYRDTAPLLFVASCDTTKGPGNSPMRLSVNGPNTSCTILDPALNYDAHMNVAANQYIGRASWSATSYLDALVSNLIVVDGADLDWSVFFEQNIHGVWVQKPKADTYAAIAAAGGFGVNGCHLDFTAPLNPGKDVSGQGNHFTPTGFDATGKDIVPCSPSNVYATLNPLAEVQSYISVSNGGLTATGVSTVGSGNGVATLAASMPTYFEARLDAVNSQSTGIGLVNTVLPLATGAADGVATWWPGLNQIRDAKGQVVGSLAGKAGDVAMVAYSPALGYVWFGKNGTWFNDGKPDAGVNPSVTGAPSSARPRVNVVVSGGASQITLNFGQRPFVYGPPAGFKTLCTANLPEPAVKDPADALAQATTTGANMVAVLDAATAHWNGQWLEIVKRRETSEDWRVRFSDDPANVWAINNANAKTAAPALAAAGNYVGTRLRIGAKYGVWTAEVVHTNGTATTVPHGLGTVRNAVIATRVSAGGDRCLWHPDMTAGTLGKLNGAAVALAADGTLTAFGADSFQIASSAPSGTYRVLVLAERPGLLTLSTLTGNGVADGGFAAADVSPLLALMVPASAANRRLWDAARNPANPASITSALNLPDSESTAYAVDMVVGGVKARTTDAAVNGSGVKYHLLLWGRPVGGVCVAPATAR